MRTRRSSGSTCSMPNRSMPSVAPVSIRARRSSTSSLSPLCPRTTRLGSTPCWASRSSASRPRCVAGSVCTVTGTPVCRWAAAAAASTRRTSGVAPARSRTILSIAARTPVPAMPSWMSRTKSSSSGSGPSSRRPGPRTANVTGSAVGAYQPVLASRWTGTWAATCATSATSRPRPGTVRSTTVRTPSACTPVQPVDRGGDHRRRVPLGVGEVHVELVVADEHVLVQQRRPEVGHRDRPAERVDLPDSRHSDVARMAS